MINFNEIFNQDAFKSIEKERLDYFKKFAEKIQGKNINEVFLDIIDFFNTVPKGKELSDIERQAMIECIVKSLSKDEQKKFINILEMIESYT